jgi:phosphatidate cytidylyltransferase
VESGPPTIEFRIDAVEAAVAAGLVAPSPPPAQPPSEIPTTGGFELPDWADPPTGQIPRVLLDDPDAIDINEPIVRKPTWRARDEWHEDDFDLSHLAADEDEPETEIAGRIIPEESPFGFAELDEPTDTYPAVDAGEIADEEAWEALLKPAESPRRRAAHRATRARRVARVAETEPEGVVPEAPAPRPRRQKEEKPKAPTPRNALVATATGLALGLVAVLCLLGGPAPADGLVAALGTVAAGEFFGVLQRSGYRPATIVGLIAVPACVVAAYIDGPSAIAVVVALAFVASGGWFLRKSASDEPLVDAAVTLFVVCWVGVLGGFAGLLLAPSIHPFGHGIGLIFGVIACTVGHDVGSYLVGSKLGKHKIAPRVSPGKTIEGLIGGTVFDIVVAVAVVSRCHPFSTWTALLLGVVVAVMAPLGDLIESAVKRDLGVKDMGSLLPAHGGVFDRVDAMLVVMPVAYLLFRIANVQ